MRSTSLGAGQLAPNGGTGTELHPEGAANGAGSCQPTACRKDAASVQGARESVFSGSHFEPVLKEPTGLSR